MQLPELSVKSTNVSMISTFLGYNHNLRISEGEFYDTRNLTTDYYPLFASRPRRGIVTNLKNPQGIYGCARIVYVDDNKLYYDQSYVCDLKDKFSGSERYFSAMGAYLCVFPDKLIYNTETGEVEEMENTVETTENPVFSLCKLDGTLFDEGNTYTGTDEPDTTKYKYWIDTSENTVVIKVWSDVTSEWSPVGTTYVKVSAPGIGHGFKQYDAVTFSGVEKSGNIYNDYDFNQSNILYGVGEDYVIILGFINRVFTNAGNIKLKREVPDMDFVAEMGNRVWGCSSEKHEIYACKQGDPKNWNCFMGAVSDSYAATTGTDGDFTGCINYLGTMYFFKDAGVYVLFGDKPSNYQIDWKPLRGVQKGSEKSLVMLNEYLVYKSRDGICIFDGSSPESISASFGTENYYEAVGGVYRGKYYISMRNDQYEHFLFVYDGEKNMWMKEDGTIAKGFAYANGGLYLINEDNVLQVINKEKIYTKLFPMMVELGEEYYHPGNIYPGDVTQGKLEEPVEWSATTGDMGLESPYGKYIRRMRMRAQIDTNASLKVEVMYDSSGVWEEIIRYYAARKRSIELPLRVRRCDHMKMRFSGCGEVKIYSLMRETEEEAGKP